MIYQTLYIDPPESLSFLNSVHSRLPSPHLPPHADPKSESYDPSLSYTPPPPPASEAYALSLCNLAYALLLGGDLTGSKEKLDEAEGVLSGLDRVEGGGRVMGGFYGVSADYHKVGPVLARCPCTASSGMSTDVPLDSRHRSRPLTSLSINPPSSSWPASISRPTSRPRSG